MDFLSSLRKSGEGIPSPDFLKRQKLLMRVAGVLTAVIIIYFLIGEETPTKTKEQQTITTAAAVLDDKEVWANRLEQQAKQATSEVAAVKEQNKLLLKKLEILEGAVIGSQNVAGELSQPISRSQDFPLQNTITTPETLEPKILHLSLAQSPKNNPRTVDGYIPAGTYVRAVLTSGVIASTSASSQGDPQPIMLRMVDRGNLPRGFKGDLKDAVMIGACYGDISSERAQCRLHKLSLTERNGEVVERKIEGWIIGEDGRAGIKGDVVDRAGERTRQAFIAGMLGGMAGFFKQQAQSSVFPVSPFGQTDALKGSNLIGASAASGAGNALNKLAEFSIKRAEQMSPVIMVASGRIVDVVFKEGVDVSDTSVKQQLQLISQNDRQVHAKAEAFNTAIQMQ